jgi:hypothetical protein
MFQYDIPNCKTLCSLPTSIMCTSAIALYSMSWLLLVPPTDCWRINVMRRMSLL